MLLEQWVDHCTRLSREEADFYSGARKIIRSRTLRFTGLDDSLQLADAGYTKSKLTLLTGHYLHHESRDVAVQLWDKRRGQAKYGSVGFTTYGHFVKGGSIDAKRSKRASVFGPCIQSVVITWLSKTEVSIDVSYRTTELYKKFPADLVLLRDVLLAPFDFDGMTIVEVNCYFANITIHPMYAVTIIPHLVGPKMLEFLKELKAKDPYFWAWVVKWTARYTCDEYSRGIQKFSQALRVRKDALGRIGADQLKKLNIYLRGNHPGHRNDYLEDEGE